MEPSAAERRVQQPADWEPDATAEVEVRRQSAPQVEYFAGQVMTSKAASEIASVASAEGMGA